jgi:outer membrane protein OmpA-like peptidoglycan-associated protein
VERIIFYFTEDIPMKITRLSSLLLTLILAFALVAIAPAQDQDVNKDKDKDKKTDSDRSSKAPSGQKQKITGVIVKRAPDSFTMRDQGGSEITVILNNSTKVEERKSNPFRGSAKYATTQLLRGLNVEVEGARDNTGALVADKIRFRKDDYMVARAVDSNVTPVENRVNQAENRLGQAEQNAQRLSGQLEELSAVSNAARGGAKAAQETADTAIAGVRTTNERISSLDDFEVRKNTTVNFKAGSAVLSPDAKAQLDEIANQAKAEKGFVIEVAGFASAEGKKEFNRRLSERRADAVIEYLVENHNVPLRRIVTPHGYGTANPVADNSTREGRQQNRRVEVRILVSRGLTAEAPRSTGGL